MKAWIVVGIFLGLIGSNAASYILVRAYERDRVVLKEVFLKAEALLKRQNAEIGRCRELGQL